MTIIRTHRALFEQFDLGLPEAFLPQRTVCPQDCCTARTAPRPLPQSIPSGPERSPPPRTPRSTTEPALDSAESQSCQAFGEIRLQCSVSGAHGENSRCILRQTPVRFPGDFAFDEEPP